MRRLSGKVGAITFQLPILPTQRLSGCEVLLRRKIARLPNLLVLEDEKRLIRKRQPATPSRMQGSNSTVKVCQSPSLGFLLAEAPLIPGIEQGHIRPMTGCNAEGNGYPSLRFRRVRIVELYQESRKLRSRRQ